MMIVTSVEPGKGALHGFHARFIVRAVFAALIERHYYIRAEVVLDIDRSFGRNEMLATVDVGAESYAFVLNVIEFCKRKDLESAAVG